MDPLNYAEQYGNSLLDFFPYVLNYGELYATPNNSRFRWETSKVIYIPHIDTTGRVENDRDTITAFTRNYTNTWEPKTLRNERAWQTLVHPRDIQQTNYVTTIQNITNRFNVYQKFPEMDAYTISTTYNDWVTDYSNAPTELALTPSNILEVIDAITLKFIEQRVPRTNIIFYCTPQTMMTLMNAEGLERYFDVKSQGTAINRVIDTVNGMRFKTIPAELMMTAYDFTEGWTPASNARQIEMFAVDPLGVITPVTYEFAQLSEPSGVTQGKYVYYEESHEDVFILDEYNGLLDYVITPDTP